MSDGGDFSYYGGYLNIGKNELAIFKNGVWAEIKENEIQQQINKLKKQLQKLESLCK